MLVCPKCGDDRFLVSASVTVRWAGQEGECIPMDELPSRVRCDFAVVMNDSDVVCVGLDDTCEWSGKIAELVEVK
jgi:hypothetical protein